MEEWASVPIGSPWDSDRCFYPHIMIQPSGLLCFHVGILLGLFDPEDGGDMFLRIVGWLSADYTALCPRR
jgi:hypothetical protein